MSTEKPNFAIQEIIDLAYTATGGGSPEDTIIKRQTIKNFKDYWEELHEAINGLMNENEEISYDNIVEQIRAVNLVRQRYLG